MNGGGLNEQVRRARKNHSCNWCGEKIIKGVMYENTFHACGGDAWRSKLHIECGNAARAYPYDGDSIELDGNWQRGHTHECNYYTVEAGVTTGCPGCVKELEDDIIISDYEDGP